MDAIEYLWMGKRFFRATDPLDEALKCDVFVSAFNQSQRVMTVFDSVRAERKLWFALPEYGFAAGDVPAGAHFLSGDESEVIHQMMSLGNLDFSSSRVLVDATGFMRPHLMFLLRYLADRGVGVVEMIYAEPGQYAAREDTRFGEGRITAIRPVCGFAGTHTPALFQRDLLVIGSGYEHELIGYVADERKTARRLQMFAFPPLQADFYQESVLRAEASAEAVGECDRCFAPASDPFATALVLHEEISRHRSQRDVENVYLSPLSTKPQALGFAYYYIRECIDTSVSVILPFSERYRSDSASGFTGLWRYAFEF